MRDILARALNVTTSKVSIGTPQGHEPTQEINTLHNILPITLSAADADVAFKLLDSAALYAATKTEIFERLETGIRRVVDGLKAEQQSSITEKQIADLLKWFAESELTLHTTHSKKLGEPVHNITVTVSSNKKLPNIDTTIKDVLEFQLSSVLGKEIRFNVKSGDKTEALSISGLKEHQVTKVEELINSLVAKGELKENAALAKVVA